MLNRLRMLWTSPDLGDPEQSSRTELLNAILRTILILLLATLVGVALLTGFDIPSLILGCALVLGLILIMTLVRHGRNGVASWSIPGLVVAFMAMLVLMSDVPFDVAFGGLLLSTAIATLLMGFPGALVFGTLTSALTLAYFGIPVLGNAAPPEGELGGLVHAFLLVILLVAAAGVFFSFFSQLQKISLERMRHSSELLQRNQELAEAMATFQMQTATLAAANKSLEQETTQRQRVQAMLHSLVSGTASATGDDFMRSLSLQLVRSMDVRYVLIAERINEGRAHTLVWCDDALLLENFETSLSGTPCADVIRERHSLALEEGVQLQYPTDTMLAEMGCEGYYAEPLMATASDEVLGCLALMDVRPLYLDEDQRAMMKVFAARTAAELERKLAAEALTQVRARLAQPVDERTAALVQANHELHRALQLRGEFLASVSHELRTPLNVVIGLSDALAEGVWGVLNARQLRSLHTLNESGRHLLSLINDILDVAKAEAGQMDLLPTDVKLDELCQTSLSMVRQTAEERQIRIHYEPAENLTTICADGLRMKQVLVNLLSNAVKFTENQGAIGLDVAGNRAEGWVTFTIWDTGIGIDEADQQRLFQPFVQLDTQLNRKYGGTGLGLVLVRRLVELHQGTVSMQSVVGQGTRVVVSLPLS